MLYTSRWVLVNRSDDYDSSTSAMVKEFKSQETLDLSSYDLEDSELLAVDWHKELKEIGLCLFNG